MECICIVLVQARILVKLMQLITNGYYKDGNSDIAPKLTVDHSAPLAIIELVHQCYRRADCSSGSCSGPNNTLACIDLVGQTAPPDVTLALRTRWHA